MSDFIKLLPYIIKYKKNIIFVFILNIFAALFSFASIAALIPFLSVIFETNEIVTQAVPFEFTKDAISNNVTYLLSSIILEHGKSAALLAICAFLVGATLIKNVFEYFAKYLNLPVINGVPKDIYNATFQKILNLPVFYFTDERKGDIISRMSSDITEVRVSMVASIFDMIKNPIVLLVYFIGLIFISWKMTLIVALLLPIAGIITGKIGKSLKRTSVIVQKLQGDIIVFIDETLTGLKVIKVFNGISQMNNRFRANNQQFYREQNRAGRRRDLAHPLTETLIIFTLSFAIYYGGSMALNGEGGLSPEGLIAYLLAFTQIVSPAKSFTNAMYGIRKGAASIERIEEILHAEEKMRDKEDAKSISTFNSSIDFKNIDFRYSEDRQILHNVSFSIPKGKSVALVGESGSGKTTIAQLLPRFYDVERGAIEIDGVDLRDYKLEELRGLIGIVTQESILFNDTIANNIAFGIENPDFEKIQEAAKLANAHNFIMETEFGYNTNIGDQGSKLSGGQRQRLSIARAIMKNPEILILDEATSALDTQSERLVQEALEHLMKDRTSLVIAHRLSTIKNASNIIVMGEGRILESGTHNQLVAKDGAYKKLHDLQLI